MPDSISGKFARSWSIFTSSIQVIAQHKKLLLFPLISFACSVVMMLFFLAPTLLYPSGHTLSEPAHWKAVGSLFGTLSDQGAETRSVHLNGLAYGVIAAIYLVSMFLASFFNTAFYHQIMKALAGEPVSIRAGIAFAATRLPSILMWSLLAGVVGLVIKTLEERLGWLGRWVMKLVGVVWSVASVFAIPVIVREGSTNPITLLRNSASTLRKTWGEALIGYVGLTVGTWIVVISSLLFLGGATALTIVFESSAIILSAVSVWILAMVTYGFFAGIAGHIYRCSLYIYATEGVVPGPYSAEMMDAAWKVKKF